ncbi:MAG: winged helix-turn-helix domain-containing protein [Candidatus Andeanibacterium colombiense]|uniref:Winged helix-turn-helix domain-containing protein n=1 Tax=Candidatus Andeanibacterium colombiense TaxID=3121345 RepID=A0AAJ5X946_9SPHN|nr:MAG: winged helix-turn-helix domain-containing protein [Sphingomonadaceae bacterium]
MQWDLRRTGWQFAAPDRADVRLIGAASAAGELRALIEAEREPARLILLGIEEPAERAALLALGCGEALAASIALAELDIRARRLAHLFGLVTRLREAGPVTLDLIHRDGRIGQDWLALHPREFGLIWRLAESPGRPVTRPELLRDVWRLRHEPETNSVQVHVSRLRSKLAAHGLGALIATDPAGGYRLAGV